MPADRGINHHGAISGYAPRVGNNKQTDLNGTTGGKKMRKRAFLRVTAACALATMASVAMASEDENPALAYRQSMMTLIGHNFGPMQMTLEGKIPWDDARMAGYARDLAALAALNQMRGFPEGSGKGKTHAKPEIWKNMDDFTKKMEEFQLAAAKLGEVSAGGDRKAIEEQVKATGKTCGSCHDDYKEKDD